MSYLFPRIKPIYPMYQLNNHIFRIGAQLGITTEFEDEVGQFWTLCKLLNNGLSLDEVIDRMLLFYSGLSRDDVIRGVELLNNEGVLEEAFNEEKIPDRYAPTVNYFSRFYDLNANRFDAQKKLNNLSILLLGLGGGGSNILTLLSGLGPKKIKIVDYDRVENGNLGRQFLYKEKDIGKKKTDVAAKAISEMNSGIEIEKVDSKIEKVTDVTNLLEDVDIVICAIDEPPFVIQRIVNQAIVEKNKTCIFGASQVSRGRVYTVIPGKTGCFDCLNLHFTVNDPKFVEQFVGFRNLNFESPSIAYGPGIFQLTAAIVDELVRIVTNYANPRSLGTQFEINYEDGSSFLHPSWPRFKDECPTCGKGKQEEWEIFQYYENME